MLSIIIPAKLPEPYLPKLLDEIAQYITVPHEVLVQSEKGLGYAVMCGIKRSKGDVIAVCDSDGSHPIKSLQIMYHLIGKHDVVVGSRYNGGLTYDSFLRQIISRVFCLAAQCLFGLSVKDNMSGFIVAKRQVFVDYPVCVDGFKFGLSLLVRCRGVLDVVEYPIVFRKRQLGESKASPVEAIRTLMLLIHLRAGFKE